MRCERSDQANAVPPFLGSPFSSHWLLPRRCSATFLASQRGARNDFVTLIVFDCLALAFTHSSRNPLTLLVSTHGH
jgi:hypothetical protein